MKWYRTRFGTRSMLGYIGLLALLFWSMRMSLESQPSNLYSKWLGEGDEPSRFQAATELGNPGVDPSLAVPALLRAIRSDVAIDVQERSIRSLTEILGRLDQGATTEEAANVLVGALGDREPKVRKTAADALGRLLPHPEATLPALQRACEDEDEWVRGAAVSAIGLIQKAAGVDLSGPRKSIGSALGDPSIHVREMGIYAFWATAEGTPSFPVALLLDDDPGVRRASLTALFRHSILASRVVPEITAALADPEPSVRAEAAWALMIVRPLPAATALALEKAKADPDATVSRAAAGALLGVP